MSRRRRAASVTADTSATPCPYKRQCMEGAAVSRTYNTADALPRQFSLPSPAFSSESAQADAWSYSSRNRAEYTLTVSEPTPVLHDPSVDVSRARLHSRHDTRNDGVSQSNMDTHPTSPGPSPLSQAAAAVLPLDPEVDDQMGQAPSSSGLDYNRELHYESLPRSQSTGHSGELDEIPPSPTISICSFSSPERRQMELSDAYPRWLRARHPKVLQTRTWHEALAALQTNQHEIGANAGAKNSDSRDILPETQSARDEALDAHSHISRLPPDDGDDDVYTQRSRHSPVACPELEYWKMCRDAKLLHKKLNTYRRSARSAMFTRIENYGVQIARETSPGHTPPELREHARSVERLMCEKYRVKPFEAPANSSLELAPLVSQRTPDYLNMSLDRDWDWEGGPAAQDDARRVNQAEWEPESLSSSPLSIGHPAQEAREKRLKSGESGARSPEAKSNQHLDLTPRAEHQTLSQFGGCMQNQNASARHEATHSTDDSPVTLPMHDTRQCCGGKSLACSPEPRIIEPNAMAHESGGSSPLSVCSFSVPGRQASRWNSYAKWLHSRVSQKVPEQRFTRKPSELLQANLHSAEDFVRTSSGQTPSPEQTDDDGLEHGSTQSHDRTSWWCSRHSPAPGPEIEFWKLGRDAEELNEKLLRWVEHWSPLKMEERAERYGEEIARGTLPRHTPEEAREAWLERQRIGCEKWNALMAKLATETGDEIPDAVTPSTVDLTPSPPHSPPDGVVTFGYWAPKQSVPVKSLPTGNARHEAIPPSDGAVAVITGQELAQHNERILPATFPDSFPVTPPYAMEGDPTHVMLRQLGLPLTPSVPYTASTARVRDTSTTPAYTRIESPLPGRRSLSAPPSIDRHTFSYPWCHSLAGSRGMQNISAPQSRSSPTLRSDPAWSQRVQHEAHDAKEFMTHASSAWRTSDCGTATACDPLSHQHSLRAVEVEFDGTEMNEQPNLIERKRGRSSDCNDEEQPPRKRRALRPSRKA